MEPIEYLDWLHFPLFLFTFCLFGLFGLCPLLIYDRRAAFLNLLFILPDLSFHYGDVLILALFEHPVEVVDKRDFPVPNGLHIPVFPIILPILPIVHGLPYIPRNR